MASEPIHVPDGSELARLLDAAEDRPLTLERNGKFYKLSFEEMSDRDWSEVRRQAVLNALDSTAGTWSDIDADHVIEELYRARLAGSRPADRP